MMNGEQCVHDNVYNINNEVHEVTYFKIHINEFR